MSRSLTDSLSWSQDGTAAALEAVRTDMAALAGPSALPGWSRRHVVAHLSANADALGNLVRWAATGIETPMYASPEQRDADIERGSRLSDSDLLAGLYRSSVALTQAMTKLRSDDWATIVVTAQGRSVPVSEVPWMRAREVWIHGVDLDLGLRFEDLPPDFLLALIDDVVTRRSASPGPALRLSAADSEHSWEVSGPGEPTLVRGRPAQLAAYLTGRPYDAGAPMPSVAPALPAWL